MGNCWVPMQNANTNTKIQTLIKLFKTNPNIYPDPQGNTLLHIAVQHNYPIEELLKLNIDINHQNNEGNTPLHYASYGKSKFIKLLLDSNADINILNNRGEIPLDIALLYETESENKFNLIQYDLFGSDEYNPPIPLNILGLLRPDDRVAKLIN